MSFLTPWGFFGLVGLIVLLIIYLIKPSFQTKLLPSTFIWKTSLKFKKRDRVTNKLRNILLIICQVLAVVLATFVLVTPLVNTKAADLSKQNIIIIDASADMLTGNGETIRFNRAVDKAKEFAEKSIQSNKPVTIILAGEKAKLLCIKESSLENMQKGFEGISCSYGTGDLKGAMDMANELIQKNAAAEVYYYTATKYNDIGDIHIVNVAMENDWNAAITDVRTELVENLYEFEIDIGVFGADKYVNIYIDAKGVNDEKKNVRANRRINCVDNIVHTVHLKELEIYAYDSIDISITMDDGTQDSFDLDDKYVLYGGRKEEINIQYYSSLPNNFFTSALYVLKYRYADAWNINVVIPEKASQMKTTGFDFYIFEHSMPNSLPTDGSVLLVNPDHMPTGIDVELRQSKTGEFKMSEGTTHPVTNYINAANIESTFYTGLSVPNGYESLLYCEGESVFVIKDDGNRKIAVLGLNLNRSNLAAIPDFPIMFNNLFEYNIPKTLQNIVFDVGTPIIVNGRGSDVKLLDGENVQQLEIPTDLVIDKPGNYKIVQTLASHKKSNMDFYVKVPTCESDVLRVESKINGLFEIIRPNNTKKDILHIVAIVLLVIICFERFLYSRENV